MSRHTRDRGVDLLAPPPLARPVDARVERLEQLARIMARHLADAPLPCWRPGCRLEHAPLPRPRGTDCPHFGQCLKEQRELVRVARGA